MAYCENIHCRKTGLRKEDVELDRELRAVLCHGCYALRHPGWKPPEEVVVMPGVHTNPDGSPALGYGISFDNYRGLSAFLSYGEVSLELIVPRMGGKLIGPAT